ncbi:hypothetical protein ACIOFV_07565 [Streptomyces mirabilis]|uniref:hypothetical protein n=1 Tax=Streptomyces mirabilis TaxID=68239 RepID=UPI003826A6F8
MADIFRRHGAEVRVTKVPSRYSRSEMTALRVLSLLRDAMLVLFNVVMIIAAPVAPFVLVDFMFFNSQLIISPTLRWLVLGW